MKKIFSLLATALLIAACTPNEELGTPFQAGQKVTLAASMGGNGAKQMPGKQRVAGVDNGAQIDLTWNEGDQITVKVDDATAVFTLETGAGTASATFTGTMPASGTTYQVSYPVNYDESVLANQTYTANGFSKGLMKMSTKVAGTLDGGFAMSADNALLGLQLSGTQTLGKIVVTNTATAKTYTLNCAGVTLSNAATLFYIVVPAGEWASGFGVDVYDNTDTKVTSFAKATTATFVAGDAMVMPVKELEEPAQNYEGIGVFSVSADKQVTFSPGNLQYHPANNVWQFAANQTDYIGDANANVSSTYDGWLDLFGWSTSATNFGVSTSKSSSDYSGSFVDWGTNKIGNDAPNTWRTLTEDEWKYLRWNRTNANDLCGVAQVNGVNGLIFLPDNWTCPAGVTFKSGSHSSSGTQYYAAYQTFTADQWSKLEKSGAVFLLATGLRHGSAVYYVQRRGDYWSATEHFSYLARDFYFDSGEARIDDGDRFAGQSVRLVKDL
ncbi:MAG: hypothetical protein J6R26_05690 [Paludibacteraceae bacterium]|nr:hypothetical protein [Paludibacteraceae bacterium]